MRQAPAIIFLVFLSVPAFAQLLQGKVLDEERRPIKAIVYQKNCYSIYAETNGNGEFSLTIPQSYVRDSLIIFSIGFHKLTIASDSVDLLKDIVLKRRNDLSENTVTDLVNLKLDQLVSDALEYMWSYLPNKPHELSAFCRVVSEKGKRVVSVSEAAISIYDNPYYVSPKLTRIAIDQIRQSDNKDTTRYRVPINNAAILPFNPIYRAYQSNYVRLVPEEGTLFNLYDFFVSDKTFKLVDIVRHGNSLALRISFFGNYGGQGSFSEFGSFTIKYDNKAILGFQRVLLDVDHQHLMDQVSVGFEEYEEKLYPKKIEVYAPKPGQFIYDLKHSVYDLTTIWVDKVIVKKPKSSIKVEPTSNFLYPREYAYNKDFWTKYSLAQRHPIPEDVLMMLGGSGDLLRQFENNGNN